MVQIPAFSHMSLLVHKSVCICCVVTVLDVHLVLDVLFRQESGGNVPEAKS